MSLVDALVGALMRADADALVMHVGEKPYLVGAAQPVDLSSRALTAEALTALIGQVLPADSCRALGDLGAIEHDLPAARGERLTMVIARGGDDIWLEIRRHRGAAGTPHTASADAPAPAGSAPPAVVLPLTRHAARKDAVLRSGDARRPVSLDRLLTLASARGATALYLTAQGAPLIRVDGGIRPLEGERVLTAADVAALALDPSPEPAPPAANDRPDGAGADPAPPDDWVRDLPDGGRVRCVGFRDHRGPGAAFHLASPHVVSADRLGLSREMVALCAEPGGLIVVAGRRASGKSTLICALVDEINRTRSAHLIMLEREIKFVHQNRLSLVSQREVCGGEGQWLDAARGALRESADVLVLGDVGWPSLAALALEAAQSGLLVIASIGAADAVGAIASLVERFPRDRRETIQSMLADSLRGVIAQVLPAKVGGGRVAARELLLNTPAVRGLVAAGRMADVPAALAGGRKEGMVPLNDALAGFVQSGAVDVGEAWRLASDRDGLRASLARGGMDVSFVERLA